MFSIYEWVQTRLLDVFNSTVVEYGGYNLILIVVLVSGFTLLFLNKEQFKRGHDLLIPYSTILMVTVILNPAIIGRFEIVKEALVLLPMFVIAAFVITQKSIEISNRILTNAFIITMALLLLVNGAVTIKKDYSNPINIYKTDDQGVIVAKFIQDISEDMPVTVCYILRGGEHLGDDISAYEAAEQYSGLIKAEAIELSGVIETGDTDYLVINNEIIDADAVNKSNYELIMDTGYYSVFARLDQF